MDTQWCSTEEFERNLYAISEMEGTTKQDIDVPVPPTIMEWQAQLANNNRPSIFDDHFSNDCDVTYIVSGRGKGGVSTIIRPGAETNHKKDVNEDLRRRIRQVSGLGCSNELIEKSVKSQIGTNLDSMNPIIKLQESASNRSTPSTSSTGHVAFGSQHDSPNVSSGKSTPDLDISKCSSRNSSFNNTGVEPEKMEQPAPPLPLSMILKEAKKQKAREKSKISEGVQEKPKISMEGSDNVTKVKKRWRTTNENLNIGGNSVKPTIDNWRTGDSSTKYFGTQWNQRKPHVNISSSEEFPELK